MTTQITTVITTGVFALVILVIFVVLGLWKKRYSQTAAILTSLGILGTFVGITIALIVFNEREIYDSVPALLGGLKIAFVSSVIGISFAIVLRLVAASSQAKAAGTEGKTADDIAGLLEQQNSYSKEHSEKLSDVRDALVGEGDTTLLSQFRLMRQDGNDHHKEMLQSFKEFSETLAEQSSKALVDALRQVIQDFNVKITDQFGDNFKQLNSAVGKLLEWQENYRHHLINTLTALEAVQAGVEKTEKSLASISNRADAITEAARHQRDLVQAIVTTQKELDSRLSAFADMAEKAQSALPKIQENVDLLTVEFGKQVTEAISSQVRLNARLSESSEKLRTLSEQTTSQISETTLTALNSMTKSVIDATETAAEQMNKILTHMDRDLRSVTEKNSQALHEQMIQFDEDLGEELKKALTSLGSTLVTVSNKFTDDYGPLADRLKEIVHSVERRTT